MTEMKKSDLEKYLNDYKVEYKKVNGKSLVETMKESEAIEEEEKDEVEDTSTEDK
jgi:hypothetical protein